MNKAEFLAQLRKGLSGLPQDDIEERLSFYGEMIDDRAEEGASEEEAVAGVGSVEDIVAQTVADIPLTKLVKEKIKPKRSLRGWEITLIILGFPVWFPLILAAIVVVLALYIAVWALVISLWVVDLALAVCALACIAYAVYCFIRGSAAAGVAAVGLALFCAGICIFLVFGCFAASKGAVRLAKLIALGVKRIFIKKENSK